MPASSLTFAIFTLNVVYPVYDVKTLTDRQGNVLPDAFLVPSDATVRDLAERIHKELAKGLLYAVDVRTGLRLPADYRLKDRDVIKIVSTTAHG